MIALLLYCTLPSWSKVHEQEAVNEERTAKALTLRETMQIPGVKSMWCMFITSCGIEYTCGNWGSTYLVKARHMTTDHSARIVLFYYVGMALGRLLSGLLVSRLHSWKIIGIGQMVLGIVIIILLLPVSFPIYLLIFYVIMIAMTKYVKSVLHK